jgi:hypothetical protein
MSCPRRRARVAAGVWRAPAFRPERASDLRWPKRSLVVRPERVRLRRRHARIQREREMNRPGFRGGSLRWRARLARARPARPRQAQGGRARRARRARSGSILEPPPSGPRTRPAREGTRGHHTARDPANTVLQSTFTCPGEPWSARPRVYQLCNGTRHWAPTSRPTSGSVIRLLYRVRMAVPLEGRRRGRAQLERINRGAARIDFLRTVPTIGQPRDPPTAPHPIG